MINKTNNLLKAICRHLEGGDAINFVADVEIHHLKITNKKSGIELLEQSIGNAKIGGIWEIDLSQLLSTVKECFEYEGDEGSHPNRNYLSSEKIKSDIRAILENLQNLFFEKEIYSFWFAGGHQFRFANGGKFIPIFWGYAFFVKNEKEVFTLIGSSCD